MKHAFYIGLVILLMAITSCYTDGGISGDPSQAGQGGSLARFTIYQDFLYTLDEYQLHTFDVSKANDPVPQHSGDYYQGLETVFTKNGYLYIGTTTGMMIYDLTDPSRPSYVSTFEHVVSCDPVVVKDNYAFVTLNSEHAWCGRYVNELQVIDISDRYHPKNVNTYPMESPKGLGVKDNLLFVCDKALKVYNTENLPELSFIEEFDIDAHDVIPTDESLIVIGGDALRQYQYRENSIKLLSTINFNNGIK